MDLYRKLKSLARVTRDREVRIKLDLFMLALKLRNVSEACARRGFSRRFCYMNGRKKVQGTRRARLKLHRRRYELPIPGQRLQMNVKYVPYPVAGEKAYSYVIVDECTRWRYAQTFHSLDEGTTIRFLDQVIAVCPFPIHCIQTDNGQELTYRLNPVARHLEYRVTGWCTHRGIQHRLIPPGVKELNGKVERSHRLDEQWFYWRAPSHDLDAFNPSQREWLRYYNAERLHGGIGYITPIEKLQERAEALETEAVAPELETLRLNFLASRPIPLKSMTRQDRQILQLETRLKHLLRKVA
jgi:transposase InsO family protein